ncbi:hypothetical protein Q763_00665 [Flavobacterium beibuense F44-8]|uniref:Uncharacterized protein n=1 Tax=Flavobacterium beibuense F44-8 TaxID=1406840 RepID=A0A0A2M7M9_9FLAO|nr:hypothetical protein [Flavobacterium beibuense]KGO84290.1 hypothetical protein Q763_00665 [Flavobacterium beibuense F44-8]
MNNFFFFLCLLFTTFQSIYFYSINLAPFPLVAFFILFFITRERFTLFELKIILTFLCLISISIVIGILNEPYVWGYRFYFPRVVGWLLFPFSVILFRKAFYSFRVEEINKCLSCVLIVHLLLFYIQYFSFNFFNYKIDYLVSITGEVQRNGAAKLKEYSTQMIRTSGLFSEPGSYCVYIYILVVMKFILRRKITLLMLIGLVSMMLSYSMTGVLMVVLFLVLHLDLKRISFAKLVNYTLLLVVVAVVLYLQAKIFLGPILDRFNNLSEDSSASARFEGGIDNFVFEGHLFSGLGIGVLSNNIEAVSVILSGLFDFGIVLLSIFLFLHFVYIYKLGKIRNIVFLFAVLLSNISFNQIVYTMFFGFLLVNFCDNITNRC